MKKKRPRRRRATRVSPKPPASRGPLQYKVVELSTVDEGTLERAVNDWVRQGWSFDGVQFAMRESSKRPAMAFAFFTRAGEAAAQDVEGARERLTRLSETGSPSADLQRDPSRRRAGLTAIDPHQRLVELAGEDGDEEVTSGREP